MGKRNKNTNQGSSILEEARRITNYDRKKHKRILEGMKNYILNVNCKTIECFSIFCDETINIDLRQDILFDIIGNDQYHDYSSVFFSKVFGINLDSNRCVALKTVLNKIRIEVTKKEGSKCIFVVKKGDVEQEIKISAAEFYEYDMIINKAITSESTSLTFLFDLKPKAVCNSKTSSTGGNELVKQSFFKLICTCISVYIKEKYSIEKAENDLNELVGKIEPEINKTIESDPKLKNNIMNNKENNIMNNDESETERRCKKLINKLKNAICFTEHIRIKTKFREFKTALKERLESLNIAKKYNSMSGILDIFASGNKNKSSTSDITNNTDTNNITNNETLSININRANEDISSNLFNNISSSVNY